MNTFIKITAHLESPMAADPPMLDGVLEYVMAALEGKLCDLRRDEPCPPFGSIHLPIFCKNFGGVPVPCCSAPIVHAASDGVEHFAKRLAVEHAPLLADNRRLKVAMGNSTYKSYRLPLRMRRVDRVVWYAVAKRVPIRKSLRRVVSLGKKRSYGYARVSRWEVDKVDEDYSLFAPWGGKLVLMRPLPWCADLPSSLIGFKRDFGACQPPYWHPGRYQEIVTPC